MQLPGHADAQARHVGGRVERGRGRVAGRASHRDRRDRVAGRAGHHEGRAGRVRGSRGSGPAMAASTSAASSTLRAMGPTWSSDQASAAQPCRLARPKVGLSPTTPHSAAGMRIEPPVSVPRAAYTMPRATAAADPLLDPPASRVGSCGLGVGP